jgi:hypothetical protein
MLREGGGMESGKEVEAVADRKLTQFKLFNDFLDKTVSIVR